MNFSANPLDSAKALDDLRERVRLRLSDKRFKHTLSVEKTAAELGEVYMPERVYELRCAALLHDITKELSTDEHISIIKSANIALTHEDIMTHGVLHSFSAPVVCETDFFEYVNRDILSAIRNHTVGEKDMSVFDKIIFISDFIEETRKYEACKTLRKKLYSEIHASTSYDEKLTCLDKACLFAIEATEISLSNSSSAVNSRMYITKDSLKKKLKI